MRVISELKEQYPVTTHVPNFDFLTISTQGSSAHVEERDQELGGNPGARLSLIGFRKKFARERLNVWRVWRVLAGFFPSVEVNTTGRWITPAYS